VEPGRFAISIERNSDADPESRNPGDYILLIE